MNYDVLLNTAYEAYKRDWCSLRGVSHEDVDEEVGINGGECYVCRAEFECAEFQDREYMLGLLDSTEFAAWQNLVEKCASDRQVIFLPENEEKDLDAVIAEATYIQDKQSTADNRQQGMEDKERD